MVVEKWLLAAFWMTGLSSVEMDRATHRLSIRVLCTPEPQKPGYRGVSDSSPCYLIQGSFFTRERVILSFTVSLGLKFSHWGGGGGKGRTELFPRLKCIFVLPLSWT